MKNVDRLFILSDTVWTAPRACTVVVTLFGASGSGGGARINGGIVTGGGAGARAMKKIPMQGGQSLTFDLGVGGAGVNIDASFTGAQLRDGNDGGDSLLTGPLGLIMTAGGGKKGLAVADGRSLLLGGAGGVATGGDDNVSGGRGGNVSVASTGSSDVRATGGGALPILGVGHRGGDIAANGNYIATGGAGIGGHGSDFVSPGGQRGTPGGGSGYDAPDSTADANQLGGAARTIGEVLLPFADWWAGPGGAGASGRSGSNVTPVTMPDGGAGGGVSGMGTSYVGMNLTLGRAGFGAGNGGIAHGGAIVHLPASPGVDLVWGGTGGVGVYTQATPSYVINTLKGGDGFAILEILP